jgi:single-stranded DNA-binding protein
MNTFNFSIVEGNLTANPVLSTVSGKVLCKFQIKTCRTHIDKCGEKIEESCTFDVHAWDKLGEVCGKYLKQGSKTLVSGTLRQVDGQFFIEAKEVNFLSPRPVPAQPVTEVREG